MKSERYVFPPFVVDTREGSVRRGSQEIVLRPKTFAVLCYLLEHSGELVSKDELLEQVWAGTYVDEGALTVCITELRKALGDDTKKPQYIATVPKRGYRFIAEVQSLESRVQSREENQKSKGKNQKVKMEGRSLIPSTQSSVLSPQHSVFVGRDADLAYLHSLFAKASSGQRQIVFVTGEPGIGKTTLIDAFLFGVRSHEKFGVEEEEESPNAKVKMQNAKVSETQSSALSPCLPPPRPLTPVPQIGRGQCIEHYGTGEAYLPILDALEQLCRASGGERLVEILSRHAPTWLVQMPALLNATDLEALQRRVVGATRERMLREMAGALEVLTTEYTLVLVLEDLHWSDYSTLDLVSFVARRQLPARLMIIGTYRPENVMGQEHPLQTVKQELQLHGHCEEICLAYLTPEDVEEYLAGQFPGTTLSAKLGEVVHHRTEGNPLFMVNVVNDLVGQGVIVQQEGHWKLVGELEKQAVPSGLQQFIEQQIARVGPEERAVLEAASVVGMEFSVAAVAAALREEVPTVETCCEALARRSQFLHANGVSEWPDGTAVARYRFLHALYQNVLYEQVSVGRRIGLHRQVGERLEAAYGNRTREIATELAVHFEQGRDVQRTVQYLWHAGENAVQQNAHVEAISLLNHAIELLQTLPDTPERAQQELGLYLLLRTPLASTKGYVAPEVEHAYRRAYELCQRVGGAPQLFMVLGGPYALHLLRAELPAAYRVAEERMRLTENLQFDLFLQVAHFSLGVPLFFMGDFTRARVHLEQSVALYKPQQLGAIGHLYDPGVLSLSHVACVLWLLGYPNQALQWSQEMLTLARERSHPFSLAYALGWAARIYRLRGEQQTSQRLEEEWVALCTEYGFVHQLAMATISRGWGLAEEGRSEEGVVQIRQGLTAYRATGEELGVSSYLILLAEAYGKIGNFAEGHHSFTEAEEFIHRTEERFWEAELYRLYGELSLRLGERASGRTGEKVLVAPSPDRLVAPSSPEACFLKAIEIAQQQQAKSFELRATISRARLWQQQGKQHEAHQMLSEIYNWFTEGFDTKDLQEAKALLDALSQEREPKVAQRNQMLSPAQELEMDKLGLPALAIKSRNQDRSSEMEAQKTHSSHLRLAVVNKGKSSPSPLPTTGKRTRTRS